MPQIFSDSVNKDPFFGFRLNNETLDFCNNFCETFNQVDYAILYYGLPAITAIAFLATDNIFKKNYNYKTQIYPSQKMLYFERTAISVFGLYNTRSITEKTGIDRLKNYYAQFDHSTILHRITASLIQKMLVSCTHNGRTP